MGFNLGLAGLNPMGALFAEPAKALFGEDTMSGIPVLNTLTGSKSDEEKALLKKQEQMAAELRRRAQQNQQARMNALGQQMLAFNPQNQMMAEMFGADAAFSPQQFAQMAVDPMANHQAAQAAHQQSLRSGKPMTPEEAENWARVQADKQRQAMVQQNMRPVGPGPAPMRLPAPQAARRF